ncbi:unnamed protein product [Echinostoma caproni]|uniref:DDHD domain-containing protein n=1 Tax=Echinostoma caproni TaxID=27848 RepID=A0A183B5F5_9TREM|nr:unnamed protein product [Echinostoma caproni]
MHVESTRSRDLCTELRVAADQVCNLFHPTDPCSFRVEPILHPRFDQIIPLHVPQYAHYPLGDSQPTSLVETLVRQAKLFETDVGLQSTQADGNTMGNTTSERVPLNARNWEKATMIAFEALKKVRQNWWGQHRVDYCVHCPEGVQGLLARARAPIFHASYWESSDVAAFVLRQSPNCARPLICEVTVTISYIKLDFPPAPMHIGNHQIVIETCFSLPENSYAVDMDDDVAVSGLMDLSRDTHVGLENSVHPLPSTNSTGNRPSSSSLLGSRFRLRRQGSESSKVV